MGKRGPHPTPNHLKILNGVDEYRINRDEPTPSESSVDNPPQYSQLNDLARDVWDRLVPDMAAKRVLTAWDLDQLVIFCDAMAVYEENKALLGHDYVAQGAAGGKIKSPHWQIMRDCQSMMAQIGSRYGLTPGDRASLKVGADESPQGGAERLLS